MGAWYPRRRSALIQLPHYPLESKSRPSDQRAALNFSHNKCGFLLRAHKKCGITKLPKQSRFGNGLEATMSVKLTFQVRIGGWRLTISVSR